MVADDNGVGSKLVKALIEAKKKFKTLEKKKFNPHFKSKYADLAAVHDAVDDALSENGLTVMQPLCFDEKYGHVIRTELLHVSGESKVSMYPLPGGVKSQDLASAITYGRRYSLSSLLGIAADDEDDDAETAQGRGQSGGDRNHHTPQESRPAPSAPAAPAKGPTVANPWVGPIAAVEAVRSDTWKITGGDAPPTVFATKTAEHADVASKASKDPLLKVRINWKPQTNGTPRIESIEPVIKEGAK